jgi:hypothetical protein
MKFTIQPGPARIYSKNGRSMLKPRSSITTNPPSFELHAHAAFAGTPIPRRLTSANRLVLERLAKGGGATNWYLCPSEYRLPDTDGITHSQLH